MVPNGMILQGLKGTTKNTETQVSNEKKPGCLVYLLGMKKTTQLYWDYFIKHCKDPVINLAQYFMVHVRVWFTLRWFKPSEFPKVQEGLLYIYIPTLPLPNKKSSELL